MEEPEVINNQNEQKKLNVFGLISFIFSLVGIFFAGLPCGIVATITGGIGLAKFNPEKENGKWMAITGLVIGIIEIVVMILSIIGVVALLS